MPVYVLTHDGEDFDLTVHRTHEGAAAAAERKALWIARQRGLTDASLFWASPLHAELVEGSRFAGERFTIEPRELEDGHLIPYH